MPENSSLGMQLSELCKSGEFDWSRDILQPRIQACDKLNKRFGLNIEGRFYDKEGADDAGE